MLNQIDWTYMDKQDVNKSWEEFKSLLLKSMHENIPKVKCDQEKKVKPSWLNKKVMRCIKKKYKLYKRYLKTKSGHSYLNYITERNKCCKIIKKAKKEYESKIAKNCKHSPKMFWKYVQEKTKQRTGIAGLIKEDGGLAETDKEKAETLNNFFASVFSKEDLTNLPQIEESSRSGNINICDLRVTPLSVENKLKTLDPYKAQGPDQIPSRVLKELSRELSTPLSIIFNKSMESACIPNDWKKAEVTAIYKKGSKQDPGNYRPVSLTCIACKILESFIRDAIVSHMKENNLFVECQHGFRKKRSCITQLLEVIEDFTKMTDAQKPVDIIYLDFRKAFDSVPHQRLLLKLASYGITGNILKWTESFLTDRSQVVRIGDIKSNHAKVTSGIPQGSILGPVLFTIFINDLPDEVLSTCKIFADDTKIYSDAHNNRALQNDLYKLQEWSDKWNLYFNVSKCKVMHIGNKNPNNTYYMKIEKTSQRIEDCQSEKDLGITFDNKLTFDRHIDATINKANQMLGVIKRTFDYLDKDIFLKLYKALVRSHLEYGNIIWHPYLKRQSIAIERVQRRATKLLKECKSMSYQQRLSYLNLHSLKGRRLRGDLIETYKILNNIYDVKTEHVFKMSEYESTRNFVLKIHMEHCNTNLRKNSLSNRIAQFWNALPNEIKCAPNTNTLKNLLDKETTIKENFFEIDK